MLLKLSRSQRQGGMISSHVLFCLDAVAEFDQHESYSLNHYKLWNEVIYNSEANQRLLAKSDATRDGSLGGNFKSLALAAFAMTKLYITIGGLAKGVHVECKSLEELLGAEEAIMLACQNLKEYLAAAATFDGRVNVIDFNAGQTPQVVAAAAPPGPIAQVPQPQLAPAAPLQVEHQQPHQEGPVEGWADSPTEAAPPLEEAYATSYAQFPPEDNAMAGAGRAVGAFLRDPPFIAGTIGVILLILMSVRVPGAIALLLMLFIFACGVGLRDVIRSGQ